MIKEGLEPSKDQMNLQWVVHPVKDWRSQQCVDHLGRRPEVEQRRHRSGASGFRRL